MKRLFFFAACWLALGSAVLTAQEAGGHGNEGEHAAGHEMLWRVVNFAILVGGLGYLIQKNAGPFFAARSEQISRELHEARRMTEQSERRAHAIEDRLGRLDHEIRELREHARAEIAAEQARLERETAQSLRKVAAQGEQEIAAATKAARLELRSYAAALAVALAEKRLPARMTAADHQALVSGFARGGGRPQG